MAKVKNFTGNHTDYGQINDHLSSIGIDGTVLENYQEAGIKDWIHTGCYLFNAQIGGSIFKGIPTGRIVTIAGDPKTGKSFLTLNIIANAQKEGYFVVLYETENSPDKDRFKSQHVNEKMLRVIQPETPNEITTSIVKLTESLLQTKEAGKEIPKIMIVVDSISALVSDKTLKDAKAGDIKTDMGSLARELKQMYNIASKRIGKLDIPMICTAHVYERDSAMGNYKETVVNGGQGTIYYSSFITYLKKKFEKEDHNDEHDASFKKKTGIIVTSKNIEGRFTKPVDIYMKIDFLKGMNPYLGLEHFVSIERCGIGKGRLMDYFYIHKKLVDKKILKEDELLSTPFTFKQVYDVINKDEKTYAIRNFERAIELGHIVVVDEGDGLPENRKYMVSDSVLELADLPKYYIGVPNASSPAYAVEHLGKTVKFKELFNDVVFTDEVLHKLDKYIEPAFSFGEDDKIDEHQVFENDDEDEDLDYINSLEF